MVIHNKTKTIAISLASILFLAVLVVPSVYADESIVDVVTVNVPVSCSMSASGTDSHTASVNNGQTTGNIGTTNLKVICNDNSGYAIYAIGYTDDTYGKTVLTSSTLGSTHDIATATTVTTGTSSWAMKLASVSGTYAPIIAGSTGDSLKQTGDPDFSDYTAVPSTYTKVAYYTSSTDTGTTATGSNLTTTYRAYISPSHPAGTYVGQVKYTLVHPYTASAPIPPSSTCNTPVPGATYMQDITSSNKSTIMANMIQDTQYFLKDSRDEKPYCVAKLADGNIWMTQNLDHDIDSTFEYNSSNTDVPANWNGTLNSTRSTVIWAGSRTTPESYDPGDLCWDGTTGNNGTIANKTVACGNDKQYHIGNYYNWTAAVAMPNSSGYTIDNTDTNQSICPAGWMLPKSGSTLTGSGSFYYLVNQLSLVAGPRPNGNIQYSPVYFVYGGSWSGVTLDNFGGYGNYWSSVVQDNQNAYRLFFQHKVHDLSPQGYGYRGDGYPIRCVAR